MRRLVLAIVATTLAILGLSSASSEARAEPTSPLTEVRTGVPGLWS